MDEYRDFLQEVGLLTADGELRVGDNVLDYTPSDELIAALWRLAYALSQKQIPEENICAFVYGRSAYLREQRAIELLIEDAEDIVFAAAMAYATSTTPEEFLEEYPDFV